MLEDWGKTGRSCNKTAIGCKKLNKKPRTIIVRICVVIQASTTCSMFGKLVEITAMCATDSTFYGSETSALE